MWSDVQHAVRNIAKRPLFYIVVILTLALGIGANAAIFTVVNGVLLQPLPYPHSERLMMVWTHNPRQGFDKDVGTYPNFEDWRRASQSFERMSAYHGASVTLTGSGDPAQIRAPASHMSSSRRWVSGPFRDGPSVPPTVRPAVSAW